MWQWNTNQPGKSKNRFRITTLPGVVPIADGMFTTSSNPGASTGTSALFCAGSDTCSTWKLLTWMWNGCGEFEVLISVQSETSPSVGVTSGVRLGSKILSLMSEHVFAGLSGHVPIEKVHVWGGELGWTLVSSLWALSSGVIIVV